MNTKSCAPAADVVVGIPYYGGASVGHFKQAVESILGQTLKPSCIHLIQDGPVSTDLALVTAEYVRAYECVQHLQIQNNSGLAYVLNVSILATPAKYYARMDADDIAHPQRLEKQVAYLEANPEVGILGSWVQEFHELPEAESCFIKKLPHDLRTVTEYFHYRNPLAHPSVMFRRAVFAQIGLYDTAFPTECDLELWGRALSGGVHIDNLQEVLLYYRMTGVVGRRSERNKLIQQIRARYRYNTRSIRLNSLKVLSLVFRLLPSAVQRWGYGNLR